MIRILALALALLTAACADLNRNFTEEDWAPYKKPGTGVVSGQISNFRYAGSPTYCDGRAVFLTPYVEYREEQLLRDPLVRDRFLPMRPIPNSMETVSDSGCYFEFKGVPEGSWRAYSNVGFTAYGDMLLLGAAGFLSTGPKVRAKGNGIVTARSKPFNVKNGKRTEVSLIYMPGGR